MKKLALAVVVLLAMMLSSIGGAFAATKFWDVPQDHPFYDDIEWMAEQGISQGYEDGAFRTDSAVTRQAMSAFLHRFAASFQRIEQTTTWTLDELSEVFSGKEYPYLTDVETVCPNEGRAVVGGLVGRGSPWQSRPDGSTWVVTLFGTSLTDQLYETDDTASVTVWALCLPGL